MGSRNTSKHNPSSSSEADEHASPPESGEPEERSQPLPSTPLDEIKEATTAISGELRGLEEQEPGTLNRVLSRWEQIQDHNQRMDNELLELDREDMRRSHRQSEWALGILVALALAFLVSGLTVALVESPTAGVILALGGVTVTLGGAFLFAIGSSKQ